MKYTENIKPYDFIKIHSIILLYSITYIIYIDYHPSFYGGAHGVMVIVVGNGHGDTRLIAFHIALGKGMNPIILLPAMGK